jgi:hypothetical protein
MECNADHPQRTAGFDDSDFNLHMSNSSYAMALDSARFRLALATFPNIFRCGGWVPLAGASLLSPPYCFFY